MRERGPPFQSRTEAAFGPGRALIGAATIAAPLAAPHLIMPDWQERITRETAPSIWLEHELRYHLVAPLVAASTVWADLGCGTGLAARAAVAGGGPARVVLVDMQEDVVASAERELGLANVQGMVADLADPAALARIGDALLAHDGERIVTCFEVVEHLSSFLPLLDWSTALARNGAATFVISVPNDAFWAIENPYHATAWSEGAFEELRRLLPPEHSVLRQVALVGSAMVDPRAGEESHELLVQVGGEMAVATHFIAAYGPHHHDLRRGAIAGQTDLAEQRRWDRQRESNLALAEATVLEQADALRAQVAQFDEWRAYIHELERELGRPLS